MKKNFDTPQIKVGPLQDIVRKNEMWDVKFLRTYLKQTITPQEREILMGSGLATFDLRGNVKKLSPMACSSAMYKNYGEDMKMRMRIDALSSRLKRDLSLPKKEEIYD